MNQQETAEVKSVIVWTISHQKSPGRVEFSYHSCKTTTPKILKKKKRHMKACAGKVTGWGQSSRYLKSDEWEPIKIKRIRYFLRITLWSDSFRTPCCQPWVRARKRESRRAGVVILGVPHCRFKSQNAWSEYIFLVQTRSYVVAPFFNDFRYFYVGCHVC